MKAKVFKFFKLENDLEKQSQNTSQDSQSSISKIQKVLEPTNETCYPKLSYTDRLLGFSICFGLGIFIQIASMGSIFGIITGSPQKFAISYSLGNILSILGTSFLMGFRKQFKNMIDPERRYSSLVFVSAMILTLVFSLGFKIAFFVLIFMLIQMTAYIWYIASYIPFARSCIVSLINKCFGKTVLN